MQRISQIVVVQKYLLYHNILQSVWKLSYIYSIVESHPRARNVSLLDPSCSCSYHKVVHPPVGWVGSESANSSTPLPKQHIDNVTLKLDIYNITVVEPLSRHHLKQKCRYSPKRNALGQGAGKSPFKITKSFGTSQTQCAQKYFKCIFECYHH